MTKEIELTRGQVAFVDDEDYDRVSKHSWCYDGRYAKRRGTKKGSTQLMHRFIMDAPQGLDVDHINHDRLDNRKANLRLATRAQNSANRLKNGGASKFRGVLLDKLSGTWDARIKANGKRRWLGTYKMEIDAAKAYDTAAREHFGEFARLNFP